MATDQEVQELRKSTFEKICEFFDMLEREGLLIKNSEIVSSNFVNVLKRMTDQQTSLNNKMKLYENGEELKKFLDAVKPFGITAESFTFDLKCDMAQFLHSEKEMLARSLTHMLNAHELGINEDRPMLGTIFHRLGEYRNSSDQAIFDENGLRDVFHVTMRNVLGHDNWWFDEQGRFCYPNEEPYDFGEFAGELVATSLIVEAVNIKYLQKFFPESLERIMQLMSKNSSFSSN